MNANKNLKFFVVDDDPICREIYRQYLVNLGFSDVELFDNGQDCINELTRNPDVILLDHNMYPMDGLDTLKKIKRFNPDIYLIYVSAQDNMQVTIDALKYGAFDYIIKGYKEEEMLSNVVDKITTVMEMLTRKAPGKWSRFLSAFTL